MTIDKPWQTPDAATLHAIPGVLGVYEIADADGLLLLIGFAGGREPFGLRSKIGGHFGDDELNPVLRERAAQFRWESNQQYTTTRLEMLMRYLDEHDDDWPPGNAAGGWEDRPTLGRLRRSK